MVGKLLDKLFPSGRGGAQPGAPWVVVGLGNPGSEYRDTRHNVAWWATAEIARRAGSKLDLKHQTAKFAEIDIAGQRAVLAEPRVYVNLSGEAVQYLLRRYNSGADRLIVICDDINLPVGKLRIRSKGGPGGHNGLRSVISQAKTEEFVRVRIGVGRPDSPDQQVDHVLGRMPPAEREAVMAAALKAADAVESIIRDGVETAMNRFN